MATAPSRTRIAVSETLMCGLKTAPEFVPGGGVVTRAADLVERVNQQHEILTMKEVPEKHERELSQFEWRMRDMVQEEMRGMVATFQSGATTGAILEKEIRNYFAINQHGYAPAMFEGLLRQSQHWENLRRSPQNYGDVLEPGEALNQGGNEKRGGEKGRSETGKRQASPPTPAPQGESRKTSK